MIAETCSVFIVYSHALFAEGVNSLLSQEPGLTVVGMEANWDRAVERITVLQPDVVVIDGENSDSGMIKAMSCLLARLSGTKVISLSLSSNNANIYHAQQVPINQTEDLISAIRTA